MTLWRLTRRFPWRKVQIAAAAVALLLFLMGGLGSATRCLAHPGSLTAVVAKVQPDGTFELRLRFDLLAYTLRALPNHSSDAPMNALLDGPRSDLESRLAEAKERFRQSFRVGHSGSEAIDKLAFPDAAEVLQLVKDARPRLPVTASVIVVGHLPPGARTIAFQFDGELGPVVLTTEFPYQEPISEPVEAGAFSEEHRIPSVASVQQSTATLQSPTVAAIAKVKVSPAPKRAASSPPPPPNQNLTARVASATSARAQTAATKGIVPPVAPAVAPSPSPPAAPATQITHVPAPRRAAPQPLPVAIVSPPAPVAAVVSSASLPDRTEPTLTPVTRWLTHFVQYVKMGYTHILPEGTDHILFVLGLFLLSARTKPLLQQVTAFTVAHSLTLALALYGVVRLPAFFVEPVIAASIAFVAVENIFTTEMKAWRLAVVFSFGLIHGLGFAAALQSLALRQENLLTALLGFNVGVELGQLSVVAAAFILVGKFRNHRNYRKFVVVPASLAIAVIAVFWIFQRVLA